MSDELALGALRAAAGLVAVPAAVAITGWDDSDAAGPAGLTTLGNHCATRATVAPASPSATLQPAETQDPPSCKVIRRTSTRCRRRAPAGLPAGAAAALNLIQATMATAASSSHGENRRCTAKLQDGKGHEGDNGPGQ